MFNEITSYEAKQYLWGTDVPRLLMPATLTAGQKVAENSLLAMNPTTKKVGLVDGTFTEYFGVTLNAIEVTVDTEIELIVTGQFRKDALIVGNGHTIDTTKLKAIGLFVK